MSNSFLGSLTSSGVVNKGLVQLDDKEGTGRMSGMPGQPAMLEGFPMRFLVAWKRIEGCPRHLKEWLDLPRPIM